MSKVKKRNKFQRPSLYALNFFCIRYVPLISFFLSSVHYPVIRFISEADLTVRTENKVAGEVKLCSDMSYFLSRGNRIKDAVLQTAQ
jgi:hypothetical protein